MGGEIPSESEEREYLGVSPKASRKDVERVFTKKNYVDYHDGTKR